MLRIAFPTDALVGSSFFASQEYDLAQPPNDSCIKIKERFSVHQMSYEANRMTDDRQFLRSMAFRA
jgi:hypothetical protein